MYGVGGSNLAIGISLIMRDRFTVQANNASRSMNNMRSQAEALRRQQMTMQRDMNAVGAAIGSAAVMGMGKWYREGTKFGYTMRYVSSLAGGQYDKLSQKAIKLGEDSIFTARQVSDGMRWMAQAGMKSNDIYNSIGSIANLATATLTDIAGRGGAADWVTNIAKAWNIPIESADAITRVSDTIAAAVNKANITLYDYGESMKYAQATAKTLGVSLEETSAAIMVMGNAGMQGSIAGVAIENSLRYFARAISPSATKRQKQALSTLGLSPSEFMDAQGNLISYGEILRKVAEASNNLRGNVAKQGVMTDIFGVRGGRNASLVISKLQDYNELLKEIQDSKGYGSKVSDQLMGTSEGAILQLISTWESFKIKFAESMEPLITPLVKGLRMVLVLFNKMMGTNTGSKLTMIAAGFVAIRTAVMGYRAIVLTLRLAHGMLGTSAAAGTAQATAGYNAATVAANRYAAAATRAGMGGMIGGVFGGASTGTRNQAGKWLAKKGIGSWTGTAVNGALYTLGRGTSTFAKKGTATGWSLGKGVGKFGSMAGKLSLPAMLAGMALEGGSQAVGSNTNWGKGLGVAGDTLGWAGTGAMLGSIIPGVGTAIGAVVGGVGGLIYSLNDRLNQTAEEINDAKDKLNTQFDSRDQAWREKAMRYIGDNQAYEGLQYGPGKYNYESGGYESPTSRLADWLKNNQLGKSFSGDLIINIDGEKKVSQKISDMMYKQMYNLSL